MTADRPVTLWSPEAVADLDSIWDYYVRAAGHGTAGKFMREIDGVVRLLEEHPRAGRSRDELRQGIRSIVAGMHVVFYRVSNDVPQIVRILDGRRDIEEIFAGNRGVGTGPKE